MNSAGYRLASTALIQRQARDARGNYSEISAASFNLSFYSKIVPYSVPPRFHLASILDPYFVPWFHALITSQARKHRSDDSSRPSPSAKTISSISPVTRYRYSVSKSTLVFGRRRTAWKKLGSLVPCASSCFDRTLFPHEHVATKNRSAFPFR